MSARGSSQASTAVTRNPVLVGAAIVLTIAVAVFLSYNANKGLPFVPTIQLTASVPDAAELVGGSEVRIGGARVGQVVEIIPMPRRGSAPPFARLRLHLDRDLAHLPADSLVQVRPRSILGAKYVAITPGRAERSLRDGDTIPIRNALSTPELDESFNVFDRETSNGLRATITGLGDSLAGRGAAMNETTASARRLLPPLQRNLRTLADPDTELDRFVTGAAAATGALEPEAATLGSMVDHGATTLEAVDGAGDSLGRAIAELPPTEVVGTRALQRLQPVLDDATALVRGLRPAGPRLPLAARRLAAALRAGTPVLRRAPQLADPLRRALAALDRLARDPATAGSVRKLIETVGSLGPTLVDINPSQTQCNAAGLWARNVSSTISEGDAAGTWIRTLLIGSAQALQAAAPSPDLHNNYYPNENTSECEAGNEPYTAGQQIGNPPGRQANTTETTAPPAGVRERARRAGLLEGPRRSDR